MTRLPDAYDWTVDLDEQWPGEPPTLLLWLIDLETDEPVDCLGGLDVRFWVSDHGNIHVDPADEPYIISTLLDMIESLPKETV